MPFNENVPPEGVEFLALMNEVEQYLQFYIQQENGQSIPRDVQNKLVSIQDRIQTLFSKEDPFEECEYIEEALHLVIIAKEIQLREPIEGKGVVKGYKAVRLYMEGKKEILPNNIVENLDRLRKPAIASIAP